MLTDLSLEGAGQGHGQIHERLKGERHVVTLGTYHLQASSDGTYHLQASSDDTCHLQASSDDTRRISPIG